MKIVFSRKMRASKIVALKVEHNPEDQEILIAGYVEEDGQHKIWDQFACPDDIKPELAKALKLPTAEESIQAFTHWLYYADSKFIEKAWVGNEWMGKHLQEKLTGFIRRDSQGIMGLETLIKWHQELDSTNQAILYKYIMDNHLNKWRS